MNISETFKIRFWSKIEVVSADECWNWLASKNERGYGRMWVGGKLMRANRLAWHFHTGVAPTKEQEVCHRCDNPSCVNPSHLFLGSHKENIRDAQTKGRLYNHHRSKTHCPLGHPYDEKNTLWNKKNGALFRGCRECTRLSRKRSREKARSLQPIQPCDPPPP